MRRFFFTPLVRPGSPPGQRRVRLQAPGHDGTAKANSGPRETRWRLASAPVLAVFVAACAGGIDGDEPSTKPSFHRSLAGPNVEVDATAAASMVSGYRRKNGRAPVKVDPGLMRLAREQSRAMAERNKLGHRVKGDFKTRLARGGFHGRVAVENVSAGYYTLTEAFNGWRDSPPHRANMLQRGVDRMGIAAVYAPKSEYKVFWTLILAKAAGGRS